MANASIDLRIEPARPGDEVFLPPQQRLFLPLVPTEEAALPAEEPAADVFFQLEPAEKRQPFLTLALKKQLIINVETTGVKPWESRIICIGLKDPSQPNEDVLHIIGLDEFVVVKAFADFMGAFKPDELIGYNVSFDYRFLFAKLALYRLPCAELLQAELRDVMQILQQVKEAFVYGQQPPGKLQDWATHLLGLPQTMAQEEVFAAWERQDLDFIRAFNRDKVDKTNRLWQLVRLVSDFPAGTFLELQESPAGAGTLAAGQPAPLADITSRNEAKGVKTVRERETLAEFEVPADSTEMVSPLTGKKLLFLK